ncbi:histidine kinase, partial [Salmonella enterica subsp. enterica]|nr:histidine kinase [Salmonella enterica subsp. enterica]
MAQQKNYAELNQYHLGIWYSAYRLLISTGLLLIFMLTYPELTTDYQYPQLYYYALGIGVAINTVQLFVLKWIRRLIQPQLIMIFFSDVCVLSLLTLASDGPNLQIGLLFVITIFSASLLLDAKKALVVTLIAVI